MSGDGGRAGWQFQKGSNDDDNDEKPTHAVNIARSLAVGKYAMTFAEWDACERAGGCRHRPIDHGWSRRIRPVIDVSWTNGNCSGHVP